MKIDGHTHTQMCPHGSGDSLDKMIEKAIKMGFSDYCVTEHAPLPKDFSKKFGGDIDNIKTASITFNQVEDYLDMVNDVKKFFASKIRLHIGFEVDYLEGYENECKNFLDKYGKLTDQSILSVHYMKGTDGLFYGIDYSTEEFKKGFSDYLNNSQKLYQQYLKQIKNSLLANLGEFRPKRIGHMTLIKKYQDYFGLDFKFSYETRMLIEDILKIIKTKNYELDFNTAGIFKPYCNDFYPGLEIAKRARNLGIKLVFGSDAHSIEDVGRAFHIYENFLDEQMLDKMLGNIDNNR